MHSPARTHIDPTHKFQVVVAVCRRTFGARLATVCPGARLRIQQEPAHGHPPAPHAVLPRSRNMINGRAALLLAGQQGFLHAVLVLGHRSLRLL